MFRPCLTILLCVFYFTASMSRAKLLFDESTIKADLPFGTASYDFSYKFKNDGTNPVKITEIQTSCGCTVAKSNKDLYLSGERGEINGVFTIGERRGIQNKTIILLTNDLGQSQIQLDLIVKIEAPIETSSNLLFWKKSNPLDDKIIELTIHPQYSLKDVLYNDKNFRVLIKKADEKVSLVVTPKGSLVVKDTLKLVLLSKQQKEYTHTIHLIIK